MSDPLLDIDRYFARIGYHGNREPTLATLREVHQHHVQSIPFENLDVLLGQRIDLTLAAIVQKIITQQRGGYCFEQNTLLHEVLRQLGFEVTPLLARVRWQVPASIATPLTHMVLIVKIGDQSWLADVGFGGIGTPTPLLLGNPAEQATSHEPRRLRTDGDQVTHQVRLGETWRDVYQFHLHPPPPIDFELGNWFSCTHPRAMFVNNLVVTRVEPTGRLALFNHDFTRRKLDGSTVTSHVKSPAELDELLAGAFGLHLPVGPPIKIPAAPWPD